MDVIFHWLVPLLTCLYICLYEIHNVCGVLHPYLSAPWQRKPINQTQSLSTSLGFHVLPLPSESMTARLSRGRQSNPGKQNRTSPKSQITKAAVPKHFWLAAPLTNWAVGHGTYYISYLYISGSQTGGWWTTRGTGSRAVPFKENGSAPIAVTVLLPRGCFTYLGGSAGGQVLGACSLLYSPLQLV